MKAVLSTAIAVALVGAPVVASAESPPVEPLTPTRLLDTRSATDPHAGKKAAFEVVPLMVAGRAGLPSNPAAVVLNVTVSEPDDAGYVTVWPCDVGQPNTSNLNFTAGASVANAAIVRVPSDGRVCLAASARAHLIADATGWFPAGAVQAITPVRLADTRNPADPVAGRKAAFQQFPVVVAGRPGIATDAAAVAVNVTVTEPDGPGYLTVWPCGQARPNASNLNFTGGQTVANLAVATVGTAGSLCAATSTAAHVLVDATAYFVPGSVAPMVPTRLADTRQTGGPRPAGEPLAVPVAGYAGVTANARAAMLNVTVTEPAAAGFVTVWPCNQPRPNASSVNFTAGQTVAGAVLAGLTTSATVCVSASAIAHVVVDVTAWFPSAGSPVPPNPPPPGPPGPPGGAPPAVPGPQPPAPPQAGPHAYIDGGTDADHARWNPCQQIRYVVNDALATPDIRPKLDEAIDDVEQYTGLDLVYAGQTTSGYDSASPGHHFEPPDGAEAIFVFTDEAHSPHLAGPVIGKGGVWEESNDGVTWWHVRGGAIFETFSDPVLMGALIRHEIGHMIGLGHVADPAQLMNHSYVPGMQFYGPGDIEGLWWLGAAHPCRATGYAAGPAGGERRLVAAD